MLHRNRNARGTDGASANRKRRNLFTLAAMRRDATRRDAAKQPEVVRFRRFTVKQQLETRGDVILF